MFGAGLLVPGVIVVVGRFLEYSVRSREVQTSRNLKYI